MSSRFTHGEHGGGVGRRNFLKAAASTAALGVALPTAAAHTVRRRPRRASADAPAPTRAAKNLIFMVVDGMSNGTLGLADMYARRFRGRRCVWPELWSRPGVWRTMNHTDSANSLVTDSAAAASAWGCGVAVDNGAINITPEGKQHLPLLVRARQAGKHTGLVTTTRVTHATPAGFISNVPSRDMEDLIAEQMLERGVDVLLGGGGGAKYFPEELLRKHAGAYAVVRTRAELLSSPKVAAANSPDRLIGLFARQHLPFELDRPAEVPTLAEMTTTALGRLEGSSDGFVLQVEGGRVDHAAHSNDAGAIIREQLCFDDAIAAVLAWIEGRDDTLLVITSDHGNANPGLTLYGKQGEEGFTRLSQVRKSFEWIIEELGAIKDRAAQASELPELVERATGVVLDGDERAMLAGVMADQRVMPFRALNTPTGVLGHLLANTFGVSWVSGNHTADPVEVTALGPGAELVRGLTHLREMHAVCTAALALPAGTLLPEMNEVVRTARPPSDD